MTTKKPVMVNFRPTDEDHENLQFLMEHHKRTTANLILWLLAEERKRVLATLAPVVIDSDDTKADF